MYGIDEDEASEKVASGDQVSIRCCVRCVCAITICNSERKGKRKKKKEKETPHAKIYMSAKSSPLQTEVSAFSSTQ